MGGFHMRDPDLIRDEHGPALPSQGQIDAAIKEAEALSIEGRLDRIEKRIADLERNRDTVPSRRSRPIKRYR